MKRLVKKVIPQRIINLITGMSPTKEYSEYEDALKDCDSYEDSQLVQVVVEKNKIFRDGILNEFSKAGCASFDLSSLRTLIAVGMIQNQKEIRVLDFGGGGGYHYHILKFLIGDEIKLRWNVVETTALVKEAKILETSELKFFNNIRDAKVDLGEIDLVFTSGALQYCPSPIDFLHELINLNSKNLFITRTAFTINSKRIVGIQSSRLAHNGPGSLPSGFEDKELKYPVVFEPINKVLDVITKKYKIKFKINEDQAAYKVGLNNMNMYGFYCNRL